MAIDTENKRRSAGESLEATTDPVADGTIDAPDRAHIAFIYSGNAFSAPAAEPLVLDNLSGDMPLTLSRHRRERRQLVFRDAFAGDGGLPIPLRTEMRTDLTMHEIGPHTYEARWTSTESGGPWYVVYNGVVIRRDQPNFRFTIHPNEDILIEVLIHPDDPRHRFIPSTIIFSFEPVVDAVSYRIEQKKLPGPWSSVGLRKEDGSGAYLFRSQPLSTGVYVHRVVSIDASDKESVASETDELRIVRRERAIMEDLTFVYDSGTGIVTVDKP